MPDQRELTIAEGEELEQLVDRRGLAAVLAALSDMAGAKADHIAANWQDSALAGAWTSLSLRLDRLAGEARRRGLL